MMQIKDRYNCEFFVRLKKRLHDGEADWDSTETFLTENCSEEDKERIMGWLRRPIHDIPEEQLLTMSKFDL